MARITAELDMDARNFFAGFDRSIAKSKAARSTMERDWNGFSGVLGNAGKGMAGELEGVLAGAGVAAGAAAIKALVDSYGDLNDKATALQESPETLQRVGQVAREAGSSVDGLANAMLKLERNLSDPENAKAAEALERYGVTAEGLMSLPLDEKIATLADAFQQARQSGTGLADMQTLLGRGSADLIPLLSQTGDALRDMFRGVDALSNDAVQRLDTLGDKLDRLAHNASTFAGRAVDSVVGLVRAANAAVTDLVTGKDLGTTFGQELQAEEFRSGQQDRDRRAKARAMQAATDQAAAAKTAADLADKQKAADDKAARDKATGMERIAALQKSIQKAGIEALPDDQKLPALKAQLQGVFETMQKSGGSFFDPSIEGLKQLAAARLQGGDIVGAESTLKLLQEALAVASEISSVTASLAKDSDTAGKKLAEQLDALRKDTGKAALDLLPPKARIDEFRRQLETAIGSAITGKGDIAAGLQRLQKEAEDARQRGDSEGEKAALTRLRSAQDAARELSGSTSTVDRQAVIGSLGGAVNRLLGRSPAEMVAIEGKRTNQALDRIEKVLKDTLTELKKNQPQPVGATFF